MSATNLAFKLTVNDSEYDVSDNVSIQVIENSPPDINIVDVGRAMFGDRVILDGSGTTDADNDNLIYTWTQVDGNTVSLSNARSSIASFTLTDISGYSGTFKLTVNDGTFSSSETITVYYTENYPPIAYVIGYVVDEYKDVVINSDLFNNADYRAPHGVTFVLDGSESTDDYPLIYEWTQLSGNSVRLNNANNDVATFNTGVNTSPSLYEFQLTVTDSVGNTDTRKLTVAVDGRVYSTANAGVDQTVREGDYVHLDGSASTRGNEYTAYSWKQISGTNISIDNVNGDRATFTAPSGDNVLIFELSLTDGIYSDSDRIRVTVEANESPDVNAGSDKTARSGEVVDLSGYATGSNLYYDWRVVSGPNAYIEDYYTLTPYFEAPHVTGTETMVIELTVFDDYGESSSDLVNVVVRENASPVADIKEDYQFVASGDRVTLDASTSHDPDNDSLTYEWIQDGGPEISINGSGDRVSFIAPVVGDNYYADNRIYMILRVSDGALMDEIYFSVDVTNNARPVISTQSAVTVSSGSTFTLTATITDDDLDNVYAVWYELDYTAEYVSETSMSGVYTITFNAPTVTSGTEILKFDFDYHDGEWNGFETVTVTVRP